MVKEHYPYLAPALFTVTACTLGAYLIWRKRVVSQEPNASETPNRRTDAVAEERTLRDQETKSLKLVKEGIRDGRIMEASLPEPCDRKTVFEQFHDAEKITFPVHDELELFAKVRKTKIIDQEQKSEPKRIFEGMNTSNDSEHDELIIHVRKETGSCEELDEINYNLEENMGGDRRKQVFPSDLHQTFESVSGISGAQSIMHNTTDEESESEESIEGQQVISPVPCRYSDSESEAQDLNLIESVNYTEDLSTVQCWDSDSRDEVNLLDLAQSSVCIYDDSLLSSDGPLLNGSSINTLDLNGNVDTNNEEEDGSNINEDINYKKVIPQTSSSQNEVINSEPSDAVILLSPPKTSGSESEIPDYKPDEDTSDSNVSRSDDIQNVLGFLRLTKPAEQEDLVKMVFHRRRWRRDPMYLALREGNLSVVQSLLRLGASVDFADKQGQLPAHLAASAGNIDLLETLIKWGCDLFTKDMFGYTPFHTAALAGQTETVKWLHEHGATLEDTSWAGWTALHLAVMNGHYDTSVYLLEIGAFVNARDKDCWTPLYLAKVYKQNEIITLLQSWGGTM